MSDSSGWSAADASVAERHASEVSRVRKCSASKKEGLSPLSSGVVTNPDAARRASASCPSLLDSSSLLGSVVTKVRPAELTTTDGMMARVSLSDRDLGAMWQRWSRLGHAWRRQAGTCWLGARPSELRAFVPV